MIKSYLENIDPTVFKNYGYLLVIQIANFVLPLIALPYLVITLNTDKYGLVMIAQSLAIILGILVDFGFNISATREVSILREDKKQLSQFFSNVYGIKGVLVILSFLILLLLTYFVPKFQSDPIVYLLSFGIVLGQAIFPTWFFQGIEKMKVITIINVIAKAFFTVSIFFFILNPEDYLWVPILNSFGFIISGLFGFLYSLKFVRLVAPKFTEMKLIAKESSSLLVSNFAVNLYTYSNTLVLGLIGGDSIAGIYSSMEKLVLAIKSIYAPLYQAIFPYLSKKKRNEILDITKTLIKPVLATGLLATLFLFFVADYLLKLIYNKPEISEYYQVFQILSFIAIFSALNMLFVTLFFPSIKRYKLRMKILTFCGILHLGIVIGLTQFYSIYGVAMAASFTEFFILIVAYKFFKKELP